MSCSVWRLIPLCNVSFCSDVWSLSVSCTINSRTGPRCGLALLSLPHGPTSLLLGPWGCFRLALALSWLGLASFRLPLTFCSLLGLSALAPSAWPLPTFMPSPGSFLPPWPSWPFWSEFELLGMLLLVPPRFGFRPWLSHLFLGLQVPIFQIFPLFGSSPSLNRTSGLRRP